MTGQKVYVDTSAFAPFLTGEPSQHAVAQWMDAEDPDLVSTDLLEVELRRVAIRRGISHARVAMLLEGVGLAELDRVLVHSAGYLTPRYLRALDAIHLQGALNLRVNAILTYDSRLRDAAAEMGLQVISPS